MIDRLESVAVVKEREAAADAFHKHYYEPAHFTRYLDLPLWKSPTDVFVLQEVLHEVQPDLVIETGTAYGASALWMAHFFDRAGKGEVVSIDLVKGDQFQGTKLPSHDRITFLRGTSSVDPAAVNYATERAQQADKVLVILDSDHSQAHVHAEMCAYAPLVTRGSFLIVEDTNCNGHPVFPEHGPGPYEAVDQYLAEPHEERFNFDHRWRKYLFSFHAHGWLRRVA